MSLHLVGAQAFAFEALRLAIVQALELEEFPYPEHWSLKDGAENSQTQRSFEFHCTLVCPAGVEAVSGTISVYKLSDNRKVRDPTAKWNGGAGAICKPDGQKYFFEASYLNGKLSITRRAQDPVT